MKKITEHIEHLKGKPHHIRRRISFGVAAGVSTLVALIWLAGNLSANSFAIKDASFADVTGQGTPVIRTSDSGAVQGLAGAAAALEDQKAPAHIEIVDTTPAPVKKQADQTVLPF